MKANTGTLAALAALLMAACAPAAMTDDTGSPRAEARQATVTVENNNWMDVTVYLLQGGARFRLGLVTSMNTATFAMPRGSNAYAGQVRLLADPVGSNRAYLSDVVQVRPGQQLALQLGGNLNVSFLSVRN